MAHVKRCRATDDRKESVGIGTQLWMFDENRRIYTKPEHKGGFGNLIWREHWRPMIVVGETRVSWLVGWPLTVERIGTPAFARKLPKVAFKGGGCPVGWALSEVHVDELAWAEEHRFKLADRVMRCQDPKVLRAVWAALHSQSDDP